MILMDIKKNLSHILKEYNILKITKLYKYDQYPREKSKDNKGGVIAYIFSGCKILVMSKGKRKPKYRNIVLVYVLTIITLGLYFLYWLVSTKNEINALGADIPTAWLLIIPIANLYWIFRYCEGFSNYVRKDDSPILWFLVFAIAGIVMPAIVQSELNGIAE